MIKDKAQIKTGMWASQSCHRDLYQISTPEQIEVIINDWEEGISHDVYDNRKDALVDIRKSFHPGALQDEIDLMLLGKNRKVIK